MPLVALTEQLARVLGAPKPGSGGLPTGWAELDDALLARGLPRGRLTEVVGARGSGKTTVLRRLVETTASASGWVAYVDAARTLAPREWAHLRREEDGVWMVRPRSADRAAWCADVLLRSGAFALVILDGAPPLTRSVAVRLTRLARDAGAALVVAGDDARNATALAGATRLRVERRRRAPRTRALHDHAGPERRTARKYLVITVEKGGNRRTVEVEYAASVARRLCAHPEVPDRRGVERAGAEASERSEADRRTAQSPAPPASPPLVRRRRCAEPPSLDPRRTGCGMG